MPDDISAANPASTASQSRQFTRPSWSASSSWIRPNASDMLKLIWKPQTTFSSPAPKNTSGSTMAVAVHGRTPARRITARTSSTTVRWLSTHINW